MKAQTMVGAMKFATYLNKVDRNGDKIAEQAKPSVNKGKSRAFCTVCQSLPFDFSKGKCCFDQYARGIQQKKLMQKKKSASTSQANIQSCCDSENDPITEFF